MKGATEQNQIVKITYVAQEKTLPALRWIIQNVKNFALSFKKNGRVFLSVI